MIGEGSLREGIQFTGSDIFLDLSIPSIRIEFCEPRAEFGQLICRELRDRLFNFFNGSSHVHTSVCVAPNGGDER